MPTPAKRIHELEPTSSPPTPTPGMSTAISNMKASPMRYGESLRIRCGEMRSANHIAIKPTTTMAAWRKNSVYTLPPLAREFTIDELSTMTKPSPVSSMVTVRITM